MPIFRVFGGGRDTSSSSINNRSSSSRSFTGGTPNIHDPDPHSHRISNNSQSYVPGSNTRSTSTYPGLRIQRNSNHSSNHHNGGVGIGVGSNPSMGLFSSINNNSAQSIPSHNNSPYVSSPAHTQPPTIIRGSNVPRLNPQTSYSSSSTTPFMPAPPGRTSMSSAGRSPSVGSTTFPSPTTPYVDNGGSRSSTNTHNSSNNSSSSVSTGLSSSTSTTRPGAYAVTRSNGSGSSQIYRVTVPPGVIPGNEFTVHAGTRRVRVRCPPTSRPGHSLQITLPPEPITTAEPLHMARLTRACRIETDPTGESVDPFMRYDSAIGNGGAEEMNAEILRINTSGESGAPKTFLVTIPPNVFPGMHFTVTAEGQKFKVTCPPNAGPGKKVRIVAPNTGRGQDLKPPKEPETKSDPKMQAYEVVVPQGVRPNQPFTLMANNQRVLVTCPPNVSAGQKIRFLVPVAKPKRKINICLPYKQEDDDCKKKSSIDDFVTSSSRGARAVEDDESVSSGWERIVRVTDHKFQWMVSEEEDDAYKKQSSIDDFVTSSSRGARAVEDVIDPTSESVDQFMRDHTGGGSHPSEVMSTPIPPNVFPGMDFTVTAKGQEFKVRCPPNAGPGSMVSFVLPVNGEIQESNLLEEPETNPGSNLHRQPTSRPGRPLRIMVPPESPIAIAEPIHMARQLDTFPSVQAYEEKGDERSLDFGKTDYLRKLRKLDDNDARMRTNTVSPDPVSERNEIFYRHMSSRDRSGVGSINEILASVHAILAGTKTIISSDLTLSAQRYIRDCWNSLHEDTRAIFIYFEARLEEGRYAIENDGATPSNSETSRPPPAAPRNSETSRPPPWAGLVVSPYEVEDKGEQNPRLPLSEFEIFDRYMKGRIDRGLSGVGTEEDIVTFSDALLISMSKLPSNVDEENASPLKLKKTIRDALKTLDANYMDIFVRYSRKDRDRYRNEVYERYTNKTIFKFHMSSQIEQGLAGVGTKDEVKASIKNLIAGTKLAFPSGKTFSLERDIEHAWDTLDESRKSIVNVYGQVWRDCCITVAESKVASDVALRMRAVVVSSNYPERSKEYCSLIAAEERAAKAAKVAARWRVSVDCTYRPPMSVLFSREDLDYDLEPD